MTGDLNDREHRGRSRVAAGQEYAVRYFAEMHGTRLDQANELIKRCGNDRAMLERLAQELKRSR